MKRKENRNQPAINERDGQQQNRDESIGKENKQPVPQPKDFEEIEY